MPTPVYQLAFGEKQQFEDGNGNPRVGAKLFVWIAGTLTKATTYQETDGVATNTNPIILDGDGALPYGLYVESGLYDIALAPPTDTDPPSSPYWTRPDLTPFNDTSLTLDEWVPATGTPTWTGAASFTLTGDQTSLATPRRRVRVVDSGGTKYGTILTSVFGANTTVTLAMDSGTLANPIISVEYGLLTSVNSAIPWLSDDQFNVVDGSDASKRWGIQASGITAGQKRIATIQDRNITMADILDAHGQCKLTYQGTTQIRLIPYNGSRLVINGQIQIIPSAGVNLANTGLTAATLYYVYAYMNAGTMTLEASATTHATDATTGVEIKNGDATRTLVGMVYMNAGTPGTFADTVLLRYVATWFNRRRRELYAGPFSPSSKTNTSYAELDSGLRLQFIAWADEAWVSTVTGSMYQITAAATSITYLGIGADSTTAILGETEVNLQQNGTTFGTPTPAAVYANRTSAEGFHYVTPLNKVSANTHGYISFNHGLTVIG